MTSATGAAVIQTTLFAAKVSVKTIKTFHLHQYVLILTSPVGEPSTESELLSWMVLYLGGSEYSPQSPRSGVRKPSFSGGSELLEDDSFSILKEPHLFLFTTFSWPGLGGVYNGHGLWIWDLTAQVTFPRAARAGPGRPARRTRVTSLGAGSIEASTPRRSSLVGYYIDVTKAF